jgi:LysM repeat protein
VSAVSPASATVPAGAPANSQLNPQLVALVQQLPANQQAAAMAQLQKLSPAQQAQLLAQVTAQAQSAGAAAPTAGADQATLGAAANGPQTTPNLFKTIAKNALIFGGVGAALGFGASFLPNPLMGITLPAAPILAAIGGGLGVVVGAVKGFLSYKKQVAAVAATAQTAGAPAPGAAPTPEPSAASSREPVNKPTPAPSSATSKPGASNAPAGAIYTVKKGDTLAKIAKRHGTTWQKLYKMNRTAVGSNPNLIHPGLQLKTP